MFTVHFENKEQLASLVNANFRGAKVQAEGNSNFIIHTQGITDDNILNIFKEVTRLNLTTKLSKTTTV